MLIPDLHPQVGGHYILIMLCGLGQLANEITEEIKSSFSPGGSSLMKRFIFELAETTEPIDGSINRAWAIPDWEDMSSTPG
jgi:hypothetical protein